MADLLAHGPSEREQWRRPLPEGRPVTLGRRPDRSEFTVPWDRQVSGLHAELEWKGGRLAVRRLPSGKNQVFHRGEPRDRFELGPGDQFVIGETTFEVVDPDHPEPEPPTPHA